MKDIDGRSNNKEAQEALRKLAVRRVVDLGESPEVVIASLNYNRRTIYTWLKKYKEGGYEALQAKRDFKTGPAPALSPKDRQTLLETISNKDPRSLKYEYALWTRQMIGDLIEKSFGVRHDKSTVGRLLHSMGLSPQKPIRKAYQQDPKVVEDWEKNQFPQVAAQANKEKADILFADESAIRSDYHSGTTWAVKGKTPVARQSGRRFSLNMLAGVSPKGEMHFMLTKERLTATLFIVFLQRLLVGRRSPVFLVVDGHSVHRSRAVKDFVEKQNGMLRLYFLPPYSPELNPSELVWRSVKGTVGRGLVFGPYDMELQTTRAMKILQRQPVRVRAFFRRETYARTFEI